MPRLAALLLALTFAVSSIPALAERRVALIIEPQARSQSTGDETSRLVRLLIEGYGFSVIRSEGTRELSAHLEAFKARSSGSEFAFVYVGGHIEHDAVSSYIHVDSERPGAGQTGLQLRQLLDDVSFRYRQSVVVVESFGGALGGSSRRPGFGYISALPNVIVSIVNKVSARQKSTPSILRTVAAEMDELELKPASLVASARDQIYIDSAGMELLRSFGRLPEPALRLDKAPDRTRLLQQLQEFANRVCPEVKEFDLIRHFASAGGKFQPVPPVELDTFSLDEIWNQIDKTKPCPVPGGAATASLPPALTLPPPQDNAPPPPATAPPKGSDKDTEPKSDGNAERDRQRERERAARDREQREQKERERAQKERDQQRERAQREQERERKAASAPKQRETSAPRPASSPAPQRSPSSSGSSGGSSRNSGAGATPQ